MTRGKLIEQRALHLRAGETGGLLLQLTLDDLFQLVDAVEAKLLGEFVVDLGVGFDLHLLHGNIESGFLAGEVLSLVILREGHGDGLFIAGLHAHQLLFEAGDERARTQHQRRVLGLAAVERFAAELAKEVDDQLVTLGRLFSLGRVLVALVLTGDVLDRFVDLLVGDGHNQLFELQAVGAGRFDLGKHFKLDRDDRVLAIFIAFAKRNLRLHRGTQLLFLENRIDRIANHVVHGLRVQLFAVHLLDEVRRNLARAEAGHFHLRCDLLDLAFDFRADLSGADGDLVGALEPVVGGLLGLHGV